MRKILSLSIDEDLIARLKELAEKEGRSVSNLVEYILRNALECLK